MHSKGDKIEILSHDKTNEVIEELFESLLSRHEIRLETSMKCSDFIFDCVNLLYYRRNKTYLDRSGSYIVSPN